MTELGGSAPQGQQVATAGQSSLDMPELAAGLPEGYEGTGGGGEGHRPSAAPTLYATAVILENRLRNVAYLCANGRRVTPSMLAPILSEYADDLKAARTTA